MARRKVKLQDTLSRVVYIDPAANEGATIGVDLRLPDGRVPSLSELQGIFGGGSGTAGVATQAPTFVPTLWRLISEVPANVRQVQNLATAGLVTRRSDGSWVTRSVTAAAGRLTVANGNGDAGNVALDLAQLVNSGQGSLLAIVRDNYGRVAGTRPVTEADIPRLGPLRRRAARIEADTIFNSISSRMNLARTYR